MALLAEAGYPRGFEVDVITLEAWRLEAQIIKRMLERVGFKVKLDILTFPEWYRKKRIPMLAEPSEEQDWDSDVIDNQDWIKQGRTPFSKRWRDYAQGWKG